jgi:hypothetical protein
MLEGRRLDGPPRNPLGEGEHETSYAMVYIKALLTSCSTRGNPRWLRRSPDTSVQGPTLLGHLPRAIYSADSLPSSVT